MIICEGKTDAILIGYFLSRIRNLVFMRKGPIVMPIAEREQNLAWFKSSGEGTSEYYAIFSVGGFDRVGPAIVDVAKRNSAEREDQLRVRRLLVMVDMDDENVQSRGEQYQRWLQDAHLSIHGGRAFQVGVWQSYNYNIGTTPPKVETIESALFVIPEASNGSLETYLLDSLRGEGGENQAVVDAARLFILRLDGTSFITPRRFKEKACLGSSLSVMYPDWVFSQMDQRLRTVDWDRFRGTGGLREVLEIL
jgi:hypothetical protein